MWWNKLTERKGQRFFNNIARCFKLLDVSHTVVISDSVGKTVDPKVFIYPYHNLHHIIYNLSDKQFDEMMQGVSTSMSSVYLGVSKEKKQIGLFQSVEQAFNYPGVELVEIWNLDINTGQYFPSNASVGKLEMLEKE